MLFFTQKLPFLHKPVYRLYLRLLCSNTWFLLVLGCCRSLCSSYFCVKIFFHPMPEVKDRWIRRAQLEYQLSKQNLFCCWVPSTSCSLVCSVFSSPTLTSTATISVSVGFQIGILSGLRSMILVLFSLIWGALADRFQIRKPLYILCHFLSTTLWIFYIFTSDFLQMLVITFSLEYFTPLLFPFWKQLPSTLWERRKKIWGNQGLGFPRFILMVILFGKMIDLFAIEIILVSIFVGSLLQSFISTTIPAMTIKKKPPMVPETDALLNGRIIVFLLCAFLMLG